MSDRDRIGYTLSLADGTLWFIAGDTQLEEWVDRMAIIMNLKQGDGNRSQFLDFIHKNDSEKPVELKIGAKGPELPDGISCPVDLQFNDMGMSTHLTCEIDNSGKGVIDYINMSYSLYPIFCRNLIKGGLPLHSSLIEFQGRGILLAGPGDTGKTTCCSRLPENWKPMCDDETLVVFNKKQTYHAHPFPTWSNYFWERSEPTYDVQYALPVSAIFFLEQHATDEVISLGQGESAAMICQSSMQMFARFLRNTDKESKSKHLSTIFSNACQMAKAIPAFKLRVSLNGRFWEKIETVLIKVKNS